jgi:hypothetical protein
MKKNHFTVAYWLNLQFVMALLPLAHHDAMTRHELSAVNFFLDLIAVASPQWENGLSDKIFSLVHHIILCADFLLLCLVIDSLHLACTVSNQICNCVHASFTDFELEGQFPGHDTIMLMNH